MPETNPVSDVLNPGEPPSPIGLDRPERVRLGRIAIVTVIVLAIAVVAGLLPRHRAHTVLVKESKASLIPTVTVVSTMAGKSAAGVLIPAEVRAFVEAPIYARANGYLKKWLVDIGDKVEAGRILAEIDTPEVDQELSRSRAELGQAQAALDLAKTTTARWAELLKTSSVSEQEAAEKQADFALKSATVEAARANVHRLEEMKAFSHVTAPFAGTITSRRTDVGQLITAASGRELFRLAQTGTLRVFVRVPQALSRSVQPGQMAELTFTELPGRHFQARVVRTAGAMESDSRTLLTELELDNSKGEILAGSYAQVRFSEATNDAPIILPSNTLMFRSEGMEVGVVNEKGIVELRLVTPGRDFGKTVEILEGVGPTDRVILNPPDSLTAGIQVNVAEARVETK